MLDMTQDDSDNESEEEGSEFSEEESADDEEEDPADETIISSQDRRAEGDSSLSLRAQLVYIPLKVVHCLCSFCKRSYK